MFRTRFFIFFLQKTIFPDPLNNAANMLIPGHTACFYTDKNKEIKNYLSFRGQKSSDQLYVCTISPWESRIKNKDDFGLCGLRLMCNKTENFKDAILGKQEISVIKSNNKFKIFYKKVNTKDQIGEFYGWPLSKNLYSHWLNKVSHTQNFSLLPNFY